MIIDKNLKNNAMVYMEWVDACSTSGWNRDDEYENNGPTNCKSIGWVVRVADNHIVISGHISNKNTPDFQFHSPMAIPIVNITKFSQISSDTV